MHIPFVDLNAQHTALSHELAEAMGRVMSQSSFILGEDLERFEQEFADYCGVAHAVGVDSGLSALELSLRANGIGPGDEVIVPANTFIATAAAVSAAGALPVLVDAEEATLNIDPALIEPAITDRTRAIMPVHLYGRPADMPPILDLARRHRLLVIEDACQAHGAYLGRQRAGSLGDAAAFSFYPAKNLGCCGDGGILVTNDARVADAVRHMRNYGQRAKYHHTALPLNRRLDTLQAAILRVKLPHLDRWNEQRRAHAALYSELLQGMGLALPQEVGEGRSVYHLYVVRTPHRDALQAHLQERGIATGVHYPIPIHLQPCYESLGVSRGRFPVTEQACEEILSLPMFPEMTNDQVSYVATEIGAFIEAGAVAPGVGTEARRR